LQRSREWKIENGKFLWNTTTTVYVPLSDAASVTAPAGAKLPRTEKQAAVFTVESGTYSFQAAR
jgi:hypothetical protein